MRRCTSLMAYRFPSGRLPSFPVPIQVQRACFSSRDCPSLAVYIRCAHFHRILFLSRCHLEHLSVVNKSNILGCPRIVHRRLSSRQLQVEACHTRRLRCPLQTLELLVRVSLRINMAGVLPTIHLLNGGTRRRAHNIGWLLAISLLAERFRLHIRQFFCLVQLLFIQT